MVLVSHQFGGSKCPLAAETQHSSSRQLSVTDGQVCPRCAHAVRIYGPDKEGQQQRPSSHPARIGPSRADIKLWSSVATSSSNVNRLRFLRHTAIIGASWEDCEHAGNPQ